MQEINIDKYFDYENEFYLSAPIHRIGKFIAHLDLFRKTSDLTGDIVECGVFKGASLCRFIKLRDVLENPFAKRIIAFDTFEEYPPTHCKLDKNIKTQFIKQAGSKSINRESLIRLLTSLGIYNNIDLIKGDVRKTIADYKKRNPHLKISLLNIDVNLYESTKVCLEELYPLVVRGGIIILDDYNKQAGANKAIDDFFKNTDIKIQKLPYSSTLSFIERR